MLFWSLFFFSSLRKGSEDLRVWPDVEASQHNVLQLNGLLKDPNDRRTQMGKVTGKPSAA